MVVLCDVCTALIDLPSGAACDEINELRYCAQSLVCLRCPDDEQYKCVQCTSLNTLIYSLSLLLSYSAVHRKFIKKGSWKT